MIEKLNKLFESRVRLGIMAVLAVNEWVDHAQLKELLGVTDGNLASHLSALEDAKYVQVRKRFVGQTAQHELQGQCRWQPCFPRAR